MRADNVQHKEMLVKNQKGIECSIIWKVELFSKTPFNGSLLAQDAQAQGKGGYISDVFPSHHTLPNETAWGGS